MKKTIISLVAAMSLVTLSPSASIVCSAQTGMQEVEENGFGGKVFEKDGAKTVSIAYYRGNEEKIEIPNTLGGLPVTSMGLDQRNNYKTVREIKLPENMKATDELYETLNLESGFHGFSNLESITVAENNPELAAKEGVLFTKDFSVLGVYPIKKKDERYTEPDTVVSSRGFRNNKYLKEITFSSNKGNTRTSSCEATNIEKVNIPTNIKKIGGYTFMDCESLREVNWGGKEEIIEMYAFAGCDALTKINLPKTVREIRQYAFSSCKNLKEIRLPFGLKVIGDGSFEHEPALKSITIPDSVCEIGYDAFLGSKIKIKKPSYLKKITHKWPSGNVQYTYRAKVKVFKGDKSKNYLAQDITKTKPAKKSFSVGKGKKAKLNTIVYINKTKQGVLDPSILSFKSGNSSVAKVSKKGVVKGVKKGVAKITVTLRTTRKSHEIKVRVK